MAEDASLAAARDAIAGAALRVDVEQFAAHLRSLGAVPPPPALDDALLAFAAATGDAAAIVRLERDVLPAAAAALRVFGAGADELADCLQRVRTSLLIGRDDGRPRLLDYRGQGRLRAWVRVVAVREALMLHRKRRRELPLGDAVLAAVPDPDDDPELVYLRGEARDELAAAVATAIAGLTARERALLRYSLVDDLTLDEIGAIYRVHKSTVSRWLAAARDHLWEAARADLIARLGDDAHVSSVVRGLRSGLDLSLERLL